MPDAWSSTSQPTSTSTSTTTCTLVVSTILTARQQITKIKRTFLRMKGIWEEGHGQVARQATKVAKVLPISASAHFGGVKFLGHAHSPAPLCVCVCVQINEIKSSSFDGCEGRRKEFLVVATGLMANILMERRLR